MAEQKLVHAHFASGFKHKHYRGADKRFEILQELNGRKGFFIKVFFVNDKVNMNSWQITWEGIKQDANDVVGVPIVLQTDMQHPNFSVQNLFAKGYVVDYVLDEEKHELAVIARIIDVNTIRLIREGKLKFTSPAVVARDNLSIEEINGVDVLTRWIALHLAIVAVPAYGKVDAVIHSTCTGMGDSCSLQLKQMTASQLASMDKCVETKIPIIQDENPDMDNDQVVAMAYSKCKEMGNQKNSTGNPPGSDSQKVGPLTQTPLMKHRIAANINFMKSTLLASKIGKTLHEGKEGYWITAKKTKVFVSNDKTVDEAMAEQCPCNTLLNS